MAITHRRGNHVDFDPNKMLEGEFGYCLDTAELYYCYAAGNVKRLVTSDDVQDILNSSTQAYAALQKLISAIKDDTDLSTTILADITALKADKQDKKGDSKDNTVSFTEAAEDTDITSGDTHASLFGKILKSIRTFRLHIGDKIAHKQSKGCTQNGANSNAFGLENVANGAEQMVGGRYNVPNSTSLFILGNGTSDSARKNALELDADGNLNIAGDIINGNGFGFNNLFYNNEAVLDTAGWYRCFLLSESFNLIISINTIYAYTQPCSRTFTANASYYNAIMSTLNYTSSNNVISQVRLVRNDTVKGCYLDIYYTPNSPNKVHVNCLNLYSYTPIRKEPYTKITDSATSVATLSFS